MQTTNGINSQLSVTHSDRQDSGVYKCVAENPFGKSEFIIYVAVQGLCDLCVSSALCWACHCGASLRMLLTVQCKLACLLAQNLLSNQQPWSAPLKHVDDVPMEYIELFDHQAVSVLATRAFGDSIGQCETFTVSRCVANNSLWAKFSGFLLFS